MPDDPNRKGSGISRPSKATLLAGLLTFALLLISGEALCLLAAPTWLYTRPALFGVLTSRAEAEKRIAWAARRPKPLFLLGDSVLGAGALLEHATGDPRRKTLPSRLALLARDATVVSLGADGLLLPDLSALGNLVLAADAGHARLAIVLNARMFALEFQEPDRALSRRFLRGALPEDLRAALPGEGDAEGRLKERLGEALARTWALFRVSQALKPVWYFPTQQDAARRAVECFFPSPEDADLRQAVLRHRVEAYYRDAWDPATFAFRALSRLLLTLRPHAARTAVVLAPQNPEFVGEGSERAVFDTNRKLLSSLLSSETRRGGFAYRDLSDAYPREAFLDHCHLTAEGNSRLAIDLLALVSRGVGP